MLGDLAVSLIVMGSLEGYYGLQQRNSNRARRTPTSTLWAEATAGIWLSGQWSSTEAIQARLRKVGVKSLALPPHVPPDFLLQSGIWIHDSRSRAKGVSEGSSQQFTRFLIAVHINMTPTISGCTVRSLA